MRQVIGGDLSNTGFAVRYQPDGTFDSEFHDQGQWNLGAHMGQVSACAVPDGSAVLSVVKSDGSPSLVGLTPAGEIDDTAPFAGRLDPSPLSDPDAFLARDSWPSRILRLADERWVVGSNPLRRYSINGHRDITFHPPDAAFFVDADVMDLAEQPDGKLLIVVGGATEVQSVLVRLLDSGDLDEDFGDGGVVRLASGWPRGVAWHPDGRILVSTMPCHPFLSCDSPGMAVKAYHP